MDVGDLAFPYCNRSPALPNEFANLSRITLDVRLEFLPPKPPSRGRHSGLDTTFMPMPEATVNENRGTQFRQHYVGPSRQVLGMKSEPKSMPVQKTPNNQFGARILAPNASHERAALGLCQNVHHSKSTDPMTRQIQPIRARRRSDAREGE